MAGTMNSEKKDKKGEMIGSQISDNSSTLRVEPTTQILMLSKGELQIRPQGLSTGFEKILNEKKTSQRQSIGATVQL